MLLLKHEYVLAALKHVDFITAFKICRDILKRERFQDFSPGDALVLFTADLLYEKYRTYGELGFHGNSILRILHHFSGKIKEAVDKRVGLMLVIVDRQYVTSTGRTDYYDPGYDTYRKTLPLAPFEVTSYDLMELLRRNIDKVKLLEKEHAEYHNRASEEDMGR